MLLKKGANADIPAKNGWTPLHKAAFNGHVTVVQCLLSTEEGKMSLNMKGKEVGLSPLQAAIVANNTEIVTILLSYNETDVNQPNDDGLTPVHLAPFKGHSEILKVLIENNAVINYQIFEEGSSAIHAASENGHTETVKILI